MTLARADASPTKAFFVRMLTRDITLDDCILDLVDNSIDGAWRLSGEEPTELKESEALSEYFVEISFDRRRFEVVDNCGGITLDEAENYAFTFGRKEAEPTEEFSVGVYGIGMKRAVFKLGRIIEIVSTFEDGAGVQSFQVPIRVDDWLREDDDSWDFPIDESEGLDHPGVRISISELSDETASTLSDPTYESTLREVLARDYMLPLMYGLKLVVNGAAVKPRPLSFRQNETFAPMRTVYDDGPVRVELIAGMVGNPPDDPAPDESGRVDRTSGWYVLCNGRAVLAADRTPVTGWGLESIPRWHSQYGGFVGVVLFSAADSLALPMTTTKRSVDTSSAVYRRALEKMAQPTRAWIDYTNARKQAIDAAKSLEKVARPVVISQVTVRPAVALPQFQSGGERVANVNYAVPRSRMRKMAAALGNVGMSFRDVGLETFDYAYESLVDEGGAT